MAQALKMVQDALIDGTLAEWDHNPTVEPKVIQMSGVSETPPSNPPQVEVYNPTAGERKMFDEAGFTGEITIRKETFEECWGPFSAVSSHMMKTPPEVECPPEVEGLPEVQGPP